MYTNSWFLERVSFWLVDSPLLTVYSHYRECERERARVRAIVGGRGGGREDENEKGGGREDENEKE